MGNIGWTLNPTATAGEAEQRLGEFEAKWHGEYPPIGQSWRRHWPRLTPFFDYPPDGAEVHVYGSVVRATSNGPYSGGTGSLTAVSADSNGKVHLHGMGIDVITSGPRNARALAAIGNGEIHANGSAYNLKATSGTITRAANNGGHIHAPYLWEHIPMSPLSR